MAFRVQWHLRCDVCRRQSRQRDNDSRKAEKKALRGGWLGVWYGFGAHHLCPECAKVPPDWWPGKEEEVAEA